MKRTVRGRGRSRGDMALLTPGGSNRPWAIVLTLMAAMLIIPQVASATATLVQIGDGTNPAQLAKVDNGGNLAVAPSAIGYVVTQFKGVSVPGGGTVTLQAKPVIGGHLTAFVTSNQPGSVTVLECAPIGRQVPCSVDLNGLGFAGDGLLHQAVNDDVQGTKWAMVITNSGASGGIFNLTVIDRPV
jgi:hypothetical protein